MRPFDAPANANTPPSPPMLWLQLPLAAYAATLDVASYQLRGWISVHRTMMEVGQSIWSAGHGEAEDAQVLEPSPVLASAAADMRSASAAIFQAQFDAIQAFRRSA